MKKLFAVLLVVAMVLSLGVTAFAAGQTSTGSITIMDPPENSVYYALKVFDAVQNDDKTVTYTIDSSSKFFDVIFDSATGATKTGFSGLKAVKETESGTKWTVTKLTGFDAEDFASALRTAIVDNDGILKTNFRDGNSSADYTVGDNATIGNTLLSGYYLVVSAADPDFTTTAGGVSTTKFPAAITSFMPADTRLVLTTVLADEVKVQNKNDMPLDKQVNNTSEATPDTEYDDNNTGVNVGDILEYQIDSKVPHTTAGVYESTFVITDRMTEGLTFQNKMAITIDNKTIYIKYTPAKAGSVLAADQAKITYYRDNTYATEIASPSTPDFTLELVTDPGAILKGDQIRFYNDGNTFELSLDVASTARKALEGKDIKVVYSAQVNESAVAEILQNTAVLAYGEGNDIDYKDAETDNYTSRIVIDKFETGNRSQKLPGAEFILYTGNSGEADPTPIAYYCLKASKPSIDGDNKVQFNDDGTVKYATAGYVDYAVFGTDAEGNTHLLYADPNLNPYYYNPTTKVITITPETGDLPLYMSNAQVLWETAETNATKVRTAADGSAMFGYLADNATGKSYYLKETKAPVDYTQLLNPVEVNVNGANSLDKSLSAQQRADALTNVANVANTPGSTLPSTGGVGATLMTIGGVALILAAGAFLVLRRRKEQE